MAELRVSVPNRPGVVAEVALALGRGGVNILDMALYPAPDRSSGYIVLWIAGEERAAQAEALVAGARAAGGARMNATFRPGAALRGTLVAPPDKSLSHRAALLGAMSDEPVLVTNYLDAADTRSSLDAVRALGALVDDRATAA